MDNAGNTSRSKRVSLEAMQASWFALLRAYQTKNWDRVVTFGEDFQAKLKQGCPVPLVTNLCPKGDLDAKELQRNLAQEVCCFLLTEAKGCGVQHQKSDNGCHKESCECCRFHHLHAEVSRIAQGLKTGSSV